MMKKLLCILFWVSIPVLMLTGCNIKPALTTEEIYALDTIITFSVYSEDTDAVSKAKEEIYRLERIFSVTNPDSDIRKINGNPDTWVNVSDECFELIKTALEVSKAVDGSFDITVYPAVSLWGFTDSQYKVADKSEIEDALKCIGYNNISLDENTRSVKVPEGTSLDLGAIAKGYIADKSADILTEGGVTSALLNFGGNIRLVGTKPSSESWKIGIKSPYADGYFATLSAQDITASTAGGYERYFEQDGKIYHHILNPATASPSDSDALSATVIGDIGEVCDALSTALFVQGSQGIADIAEAFPDYSFVLLTEASVYVSESIYGDFELSEAYSDLKIIKI